MSPTDRPDDGELIGTLQSLADELGRPPTHDDVERETDQIAVDYIASFGSWDDALIAAGIAPRTRRDRVDDETLLAELRAAADRAPGGLDADLIDTHAPRSAAAYSRRFGSLEAALNRAGCDASCAETSVSNAELEQELERLSTHLGRDPTPTDVRNRGAYSPEAYRERYGSVRAAVTVLD